MFRLQKYEDNSNKVKILNFLSSMLDRKFLDTILKADATITQMKADEHNGQLEGKLTGIL